jgi:outer membrane protein OmpA-like peptidoglycan-associated protein
MRIIQLTLYALLLGSLFFNCGLNAQSNVSFASANKQIFRGGISAFVYSQRGTLENVNNEAGQDADFKGSLAFWLTKLETDKKNANYNYKAGLCYYFSFDEQIKALPYFKEAIKNINEDYNFESKKETKAPPSAFYFLADTYLENNQLDSAIKYFLIYQDNYQDVSFNTERPLSMCINAKESLKNPRNVQVKNLGKAVNSIYAETNPVMRADNKLLFFSSRRPRANEKNKNENVTNNADIYFVIKNEMGDWGDPIAFPYNTKYDEAPLYISPNGDVLYFRINKKNNSDIYTSQFVNQVWTKPEAIREINSKFNETGISISADGNDMYYCSDESKIARNYDIFKRSKQKNGKWGKAERLSSLINSPYNEVSPFITPDGGTLFFSSDASSKKGLGGLDIYYSQLRMDKTWTEPINMGYPINKTRADNNYYVAGADKRYYAVPTENSSYDIFSVEDGGFDFESIAARTDIVNTATGVAVTQVMDTEKTVKKEGQIMQPLGNVGEKEKEVEVIKTLEVEKEKEVEVIKPIEVEKEKEVQVTQVLENIGEKEKEVEVIKTLEVDKEKEVHVVQALENIVEKGKESGLIKTLAVEKEKEAKGYSLKASDVILEKMSPADVLELNNKLKEYLNKDRLANESVNSAATVVGSTTTETAVTQPLTTVKNAAKEAKLTQEVENSIEKKKEADIIKKLEDEKKEKGSTENIAVKKEKEAKVYTSEDWDVILEKTSPGNKSELANKLKDYFNKDMWANEPKNFKTIYFEFNKSNLTPLYVSELKTLTSYLREHPETKIEIAGHGDNRGSWQTNVNLSNKRAKEVYKFLVANKISTDRMFYYGKGSAVPTVTNDSEENRSKNRRAEVFILK